MVAEAQQVRRDALVIAGSLEGRADQLAFEVAQARLEVYRQYELAGPRFSDGQLARLRLPQPERKVPSSLELGKLPPQSRQTRKNRFGLQLLQLHHQPHG